jgi:DNA gyrase subunit B
MKGGLMDNLYKEDSIESLSPREHVRLRPGMYAGDTSDATQLAIEILGNAIDEYNIGHGNTIDVIVNKTLVSIMDQGQGFPINVMREDGETVLQASFDVINTSGKYRDDGVYEGTAIGLNGIGSKLTNFLSHNLSVVSWNAKGEYEMIHFSEGEFVTRETGKENHHSGTLVTFSPSEEFFDSPQVNQKKLLNFCEDITCLCPGLTINFNGTDIKHENGIQDLLKKHLGKEIEIINNPLIIQEKKDKQAISLAMSYTTRGSSTIVPYVNCGLTSAGPHITSIKSTITRILNKWAKEQNILKAKDKNLDGASLQEGMILVANITAEGVSYDAQVKSTITKIDTSFISSTLGEQLEIWLDNNIEDGKNIIEKALVARKAAEAAKKARERVKAKAATPVKAKAIQLPTTLTDCWSKNRSQCELFVCEGKSAAAGLVAGRDSETQAIYGVRGKMLSVLKTAASNIYKNQEINNLVQALGLDVDEKTCKLVYDEKKLRYGKIIAAADADFDGFAIENLLFNILWYMCPELITNGHVYSAVPPLFRVTTKKNEYVYLRDAEALAAYQKEHGAQVQSIGRLKGLGEQDSDELSYCLLDPETRNVLQLKVEDYGKTDKMFQDLYGKRVEPRVQFLAQHLEEARVD